MRTIAENMKKALCSFPATRSTVVMGLIAFASLCVPSGALAMGCEGPVPCVATQKPTVTIMEPDKWSGALAALRIVVTDDSALNITTGMTMTHNGSSSSWLTGKIGVPSGMLPVYAIVDDWFTMSSGTNTLIVTACDTDAIPNCAADTLVVTYTAPGSPPAQANPVVTLAQMNDRRLLDGCATCATRTLSYSTPAEVLRGAPRSVSLHYSSELAKPTGYVEVDARVFSTGTPTRLSIRLRRVSNGADVMLSNDSTVAFVMGDTGTVRLAAQFDADSFPTGAYLFDVIVGSHWSSGTSPLTDTVRARVLIQNETKSRYGRGWTVAGVPRAFSQSDGILISDGQGGLSFFELISCQQSPDSCSYTSPTGVFATLRKTAATASDTLWHLEDRGGSAVKFNSSGLLNQMKDRFGNLATAEHQEDSLGSRLYKLNALGRSITFGYNASSRLETITMPDSRQSEFTVTGGDLVTIKDPNLVTALSVSYSNSRAWKAGGPNGGLDSVTFDAFGQVAGLYTPVVATESDGEIRLPTTVQSLRAKLLTSQGRTLGESAPTAVRPDSAFLRITAANGTTSTTWGHRSGAMSRSHVRDASGKEPKADVHYNSDFLPVVTNSAGAPSVYQVWDGPLLMSQISNGVLAAYGYTSYDQTDTVRMNGVVIARAFFGGSALAPDSTWSLNTGTTRYKFDATGRLLRAVDQSNIVDTLVYESTFGNLSWTRRAGTTTTTFTYDASGRTATAVNPDGDTTKVYYDKLNRDTLTLFPLGAKVRRSYNDVSGVYTLTDPMNQVFTDSLNKIGWLMKQRDPRGNSDTFGYDKLGQLVRRTDRKDQNIYLKYDSLGAVTRRVAGADTADFAYDINGTWVAAKNGESIDTIYSFGGKVSSAVTWRNGTRFKLSNGFTKGQFRDSLRVERTSGSTWSDTTTWQHDNGGALSRMYDFGGKLTEIVKNPAGYTTWISLPHSVSMTPTYDGQGRPAGQSFSPSGLDVYFKRSYARDAMGRVTDEAVGSSSALGRINTYDKLGRVTAFAEMETTSWDEYFWSPLPPEECAAEEGCWVLDSIVPRIDVDTLHFAAYAYDSVANRRDRNAVLDTGNRVIKVDGDTITYDAAGFMLAKLKYLDTLKFTWNELGQLTQVYSRNGSGAATTTTYGYDGFGRRVRRTVGSTPTHYLLDGDQVVMDLDASYNRVADYTYYAGVDQPHSMRRGGKMYYYAQDAMGNVMGLIDTTGTMKANYKYSAYGELLNSSEFVSNPYRFKGREWDAESELYFMRARYYDPHLGRFISEDPIGLAGGINPAAFVGGDPVNRWDPSGLACGWVLTPGHTTVTTGERVDASYDDWYWSWVCGLPDNFHDEYGSRWQSSGMTGEPTWLGIPDETGPRLPGDRAATSAEGAPESCLSAWGMAAVTGASDWLFFTGAGAALRLSKAGGMVFADGLKTFLAADILRPGGLKAARRGLVAMERGAWAGDLASREAHIGATTWAADKAVILALPESRYAWMDYIPGFATLHALGLAYSCSFGR